MVSQREFGAASNAWNSVVNYAKSAGSSMSNFASSAGSVLSKAASSAGNAAKSAGSAISGAASSLMSGVKNGLNKTATTQQTGSTTQASTTQSTGGSLFAKGGEALKPVLDQNFFDEKIGSTPQTTTTTQQPTTTTQSQPATTTQTQTEQQGQGGGFWNKVGNFAGSVMNKTGTGGAKKTGSFMKKAAPWIAGLTAAGALAAGIGAGRFIFKDHSRRY